MAMIEQDRFTFQVQVLSEADLKAVVLNRLRAEFGTTQDAIVASEYRLGFTPVRVDIAALGDAFVGVEIKSAKDSLKRLPSQIAAYTSYFERVVLAVADCHVQNLDWKALRSVEVWSVSESGLVRVVSQPTQMAECRSLRDLLTADQRRRYKLDGESSDQQCAEAFSREFRKRFGPTSQRFWELVAGRPVVASDLKMLSRYGERRANITAWSDAQAQEWGEWQELLKRTHASQSVQSSSVS